MTIAPTPLHDRSQWRRVQALLVATFVILVVVGVVLLLRDHESRPTPSSTALQSPRTATTQARRLPEFHVVELAGTNIVTIHVGRKQAVVVHAGAGGLGRVTTVVHGERLVIGNTGGSFTSRTGMRVVVGVPSLTALTLTGTGVVTATGVKASDLTVTLSGAGVLRATGTATRLDVTLKGSGDARLEQLVARDVHAVVSGSGRIHVTATSKLDAAVPGSGVIVYSGAPTQVTTSVTGSGAVVNG
jgi:hypothetical protein